MDILFSRFETNCILGNGLNENWIWSILSFFVISISDDIPVLSCYEIHCFMCLSHWEKLNFTLILPNYLINFIMPTRIYLWIACQMFSAEKLTKSSMIKMLHKILSHKLISIVNEIFYIPLSSLFLRFYIVLNTCCAVLFLFIV